MLRLQTYTRGTLLLLLTGLLLFVGCDSSSTPETFTLTGELQNVTDRGVENATVRATQDGETVGSGTTNEDGTYEITGLSEGTYTITVEAPGYEGTSFSVDVTGNITAPAETLLGPATITGQVLDATTGDPIPNAEIAFSTETDTSRALADLIFEANESGTYELQNAPTGTYLCVIRAAGYFPQIVEEVPLQEGTNDLGSSASSEELADGQFRIVLSWGETPDDLDSHLTGPDAGSGRFHVYYSNQTPSGAEANLDLDDITSYGPETVTITALRDGMYRYSVHNYANQSADGALGIESSPAKVDFYGENGLIETYNPPAATAQSGNTWRVFEINVSGGTPSIDDNGGDTFGYYQASSSSDTGTFLRGPVDKQQVLSERLQNALLEAFDRPLR
ncbi:carboxypeptidase regulatory-like domain-containing protein [Salisaeta longa]|uniref:carboxypeptidase regulatory-like domain-containing protein n=1 Tax=Salisaeta longa TaxID=503170 RepID=UPI0003FCF5F7|nr:carboxypeptidase regulatory-like domain-containing protein [Salisaeta longa]